MLSFVDKEAPGGKLVRTQLIENYTGFTRIDGPDLALKMYNQVTKLGAEFVFAEVTKILHNGPRNQTVILKNGTSLHAKFVIIATGMIERVPEIPRIRELEFKGVSYCAICDGALYKNQEVAVIGGGNSAVEESVFLSSVATVVHLFVRRDVFRADHHAVRALEVHKNIQVHFKSQILSLLGKEKLQGVRANVRGTVVTFPNVAALFPYIGTLPQTNFLKDLKVTNPAGFVVVNKHMSTRLHGIFAAGDVVPKKIRQITTAVNDGTIAAKTIVNEYR